MSSVSVFDGIKLHTTQKGLLEIKNELLETIVKHEPITTTYDVEHTPFARGKFAAVRRCTHKVTGQSYAAKFIRKRRRSMDHRQDILHEVAVLYMASVGRCSKIVGLHEVYETQHEVAIVLELASGGELQRIVDVQDGLSEKEAVHVMRQIIQGLVFLHENNIAHLDLKPQNLLLTTDYPEMDVTLCDFGISRVIQDGVEVREILGTPDYVAPEVLSYEPISLATDIWSVGVLAYVLLSGHSPFAGDSKQETFCNISQCALTFPVDLFGQTSHCAMHFIRAALRVDPGSRLTVQECLTHPWLTGAQVELPLNFIDDLELNGDEETDNNQEGSGEENGATFTRETPPCHVAATCLSCGAATQCCQLHHTRRKSSAANSPVVEIVHDRGIIC